jgi:hypothetical protein
MQTFNIHALGPSGAGKTVFLASMYRKLQFTQPGKAYFLKTDHGSAVELNALFNRTANPDELWPEGNRTIKEWTFTSCVSTGQGTFEPLAFNYFDYPGGVLTNPNAADDEKVQQLVERLRRANGLLALLDGRAIGALMRGEREGMRFLEFELTRTFEIIQESRCPVQFIITKWDLLESQYDLGQIRDRLMEDDRFSTVIASRKQNSPAKVRLIPVSSVGAGFAELQPDGMMRKSGRPIRPFQVELPLVGVIPDFLQFVYDDVGQRTQRLLDGGVVPDTEVTPANKWQAARRRWIETGADGRWSGVARRAALVMMPHVRRALLLKSPSLAKYMPNDPELLVEQLFQFVEHVRAPALNRAASERAIQQADLDKRLSAVRSEQDALELMQRQLVDALMEFEAANPESVLCQVAAV